MEKTCENCGYGPREVIPGVSCDSFCGEMDPRQPSLWIPKPMTDKEAIEKTEKEDKYDQR